MQVDCNFDHLPCDNGHFLKFISLQLLPSRSLPRPISLAHTLHPALVVWTLLLTDEAMLFVDLSQVLLPWKECKWVVGAAAAAAASAGVAARPLPAAVYAAAPSCCCCCCGPRFCFIFRQKFPWSLNSLMQRPSSAIESTTTRISIEVWSLKSFLGFCFAPPYFRLICCCGFFCCVFVIVFSSACCLCVKELSLLTEV